MKYVDDYSLNDIGGIIENIHNYPKNWKIDIRDNHFDIEHIDYMLSWRGCREESVIVWNGNCFRTINGIFPDIKLDISDKRIPESMSYPWEDEDYQKEIYIQILNYSDRVREVASYLEPNFTRMLGSGDITRSQVGELIQKASDDFDSLISELQQLKLKTIELLKHYGA
ncbi:MAG: hypothetical protein WC888_04525 [Candidatus Izemoplasmatales bacterium]|jgi:hypothetical protein